MNELQEDEYHEHPQFNGQWHQAVWVQTWVATRSNEIEAPDETPVTCAICGKVRDEGITGI